MPTLVGKLERVSGTQAVFSSRKGEWRPLDIRAGAREAAERATPGEYYQLDVEGNDLTGMRPAPARSPNGGGGSATAAGPPRARGAVGGRDPSPSACSITAALCASGQIKGLAEYLDAWATAYRHVQRIQSGESVKPPEESRSAAARVLGVPAEEAEGEDIPW